MSAPSPSPQNFLPAFGMAITPDGVKSWNSAFHRRKQRVPHTAVMETDDGWFVFLFAIKPNIRVQTRAWKPGITILDGAAVEAMKGTWVYHPDQAIAKAPRWLVRQVESEPIRDKIELTNEGDVAGLTAEMIRRFPIVEHGTRNNTMVKALCSLAGREFQKRVIVEVVDRWWEHFHRIGTARTKPDTKVIADSLEAILLSRTLKPANRLDHIALCRAIECPEIPAGIAKTKMERRFVESLVVHAIHRLVNAGDNPDGIQTTLQYISQIMHARHGIKLAKATLLGLSRKYVSTEEHAATIAELAFRTERGWRGTASLYELRGWLRMIVEESPAHSLRSLGVA